MGETNKDIDAAREVEKFNDVADKYSDVHASSVAASGEGVEYFAQYKVNRLLQLGFTRDCRVLDYGCGIGNLTVFLDEQFEAITGYDPSPKSIEQAQKRGLRAKFATDTAQIDNSAFDLAVLAGVLHHIPPTARNASLQTVLSKLRPGGRIVVFEHNPYNPLTRRAVDACPFDDDAILLPPHEVRSRLVDAGFSNVTQKFVVFFPRTFAWFRPVEPALGFLPLGAQTMTVASR